MCTLGCIYIEVMCALLVLYILQFCSKEHKLLYMLRLCVHSWLYIYYSSAVRNVSCGIY